MKTTPYRSRWRRSYTTTKKTGTVTTEYAILSPARSPSLPRVSEKSEQRSILRRICHVVFMETAGTHRWHSPLTKGPGSYWRVSTISYRSQGCFRRDLRTTVPRCVEARRGAFDNADLISLGDLAQRVLLVPPLNRRSPGDSSIFGLEYVGKPPRRSGAS